jgi:hypothetical protein
LLYRIRTAADLADINNHPNDLDANFVMIDDVNTAAYMFTTAVIASDTSGSDEFHGTIFTGVFDGNGHTIINLTIDTLADADTSNDENKFLCLFGYIVTRGEVKNLGI